MATLSCVAMLALLWGFHNLASPIISSPRYTTDGHTWASGQFPLSFPSSGQDITVEFPVLLSPLAPHSLSIRPDDCLNTLVANGVTVVSDALPFCDYTHGKTIDLRAYLHTGDNTLTLMIRDHGGMGGVDIRAPMKHPLILLLTLGWISVLSWYVWRISVLLPIPTRARPVILIVAAGALLRLLYLFATPYTVRGHDADGHLEYVQHLLSRWTLPDPHGGWEFYQPPLYYLLGAGWIGLLRFFDVAASPPILLQSLSFILATAALAVGGFVALRLFHNRSSPVLFTAVLATFPSAVFFTARVNNDVLFLLLGTVSIALLLQWWSHHYTSTWYLFITAMGLNLLTKFNAAILFPSLLFPYLRHGTMRRNLERSAASCFLLLLMTGWFYFPRALTEEHPQTLIVGNIDNLNSGLRVTNTLSSLAIFNPLQVLSHPFNNAWSDSERRQYFWEYLFRSAFFGEFSHAPSLLPLAVVILAIALFLTPLAFFGAWTSIRCSAPGAIPLFHLLWTGFIGSLAYRILYPFASSQDFRYAILLMFPVVFFLVHGISALPKIPRRFASAITFTFAGFCAAFVLAVSILP